MVKVDKILRSLMDANKLTQKQLASIINGRQTSISNWVNGRNEPSIESLWKLADYFDVSVDYLIGRKEI